MTKKEACRAVLFLAGFLFLFVSVSYILRTNGGVKERFTGFYAEKDNTIDVFLLGSSPVYPFYSAPKMYGEEGIASYPLSTNNQRPRAIKYLIKEGQKTQDPQLFVIELRMFTMPDEEWEDTMVFTRGVTDNMKYSWNRIETINDMVSDKSQRLSYYLDIFKYHSNWGMLFMPSELACFDYEKAHPLKGLEIEQGVGPTEGTDFSAVTEKEAIPKEQEEVLKDLLSFIEDTGKEALFLVSPYEMSLEERKKFNYMRPIIEQAGYQMLDMNLYYEEIGIDFSADYYDYGSHVNALGEEKCTAYLQKYLKENYDLQDRRGQAGYDSWDEAYEYWKEVQKKEADLCLSDIENGHYTTSIEQ